MNIIIHPVKADRFNISDKKIHPAKPAKTDSKDRINADVVASEYRCATSCNVYATPTDNTPAYNSWFITGKKSAAAGCSNTAIGMPASIAQTTHCKTDN